MSIRTLMVHANADAGKMPDRVTNSVHAARTKSGMTQEEVAEKAGVSRQTIIAIEKGNYAPSVVLALKLAKIFKIPVEELFKISS